MNDQLNPPRPIEDGIPIPSYTPNGRSGAVLQIRATPVGKSFTWPKDKLPNLRAQMTRMGVKYTSRTLSPDEARVWIVDKPEGL